ncbi:MAG TPA: YchJ family metal-binding protein [Agitococcus sp.]|nr:YchJ family metal-binding protein [Agitococcus sp.]
MRSRYTAFVLQKAQYLLDTHHRSTCLTQIYFR